MAAITISRAHFDEMLAHLLSAYPQEGCGLLAGMDGEVTGVHPVTNILRSSVAYEMEPREQILTMLAIEEAGHEIVAIFHSHPHGPAAPSETDVAQNLYPDVGQVIVSLADRQQPVARAFRIREEQVQPIDLRVQ
jgi:proteasome lid subunit RPN8/RPN11